MRITKDQIEKALANYATSHAAPLAKGRAGAARTWKSVEKWLSQKAGTSRTWAAVNELLKARGFGKK